MTPGEHFTISAIFDGGGDKYLLDIKSLRFELLIEMGLRPSNLVPTKCVVTWGGNVDMATFHKNDITRVKSALSSACISCNQCTYLAKYPGLFAPVFVAKGLVKLVTCGDIPGRVEDVWRSGPFLLYSCQVAILTQEMSSWLPDVDHPLAAWVAITHLPAVFWECATPPHVHLTPRYVIACDKFWQPSQHYCAQRGVYSLVPRSFHPSVAVTMFMPSMHLLSKPVLYNRLLLNNSFRLSLSIIYTSSFTYNEQSSEHWVEMSSQCINKCEGHVRH